VVKTNESPPALGENPTVAQLRSYETESLKKDKTLTCLHSGNVNQIFTSIIDLEIPKVVWDKLQETFEDLKSKAIEDIISIGSFMEVLVLNQYVLVRKILIHVTPERSFFISLDTKDNPRVKLGDGRYARAKRIDMLSVPQMIKNGYGVNFKNDSRCVITDSRDSKIATLDMHMYTTKLVRDMPLISEVDSKCEGFELGKSRRLPFLKSGVMRATHKLEIVHSDICGPMSTPSWSGSLLIFFEMEGEDVKRTLG
ncbi:hypothetical protein Tco_0418520, partial [Tanacetum coccineum]